MRRTMVLAFALTALLASAFARPAFAVGGIIRGEGCEALEDAATTQETQELPQEVLFTPAPFEGPGPINPSQGAENSAVAETGNEHGCGEFPDPR